MKFEDLILEELNTEEFSEEDSVYINESFIPITPLLAYMSFKKSAFDTVKDSFLNLKQKVGQFAKRKKAEALIGREKTKAHLGKTAGKGDDATVYRLRQPQMEVMSEIYKKYGNEIVKDIFEFRKNILAPYSLIKRRIKEAQRVTNKDKFGMTKAEFKAALESGRKKIENRGEKFIEKSQELSDRLDRINSQIDLLKSAKEAMDDEEADIPRSILQRLYKEFDVDDKKLEGYTPEELRKAKQEIDKVMTGEKVLSKNQILNKIERKDKDLDDEDDESATKSKKGFDIALSRYMFREKIMDDLKDFYSDGFVRSIYEKIINEMHDNLVEKKREITRRLSSMNNSTKLNEKEAKIWKKRKTASEASNDLNDYYQAIKEEDFLDTPIYLERTPELKDAEQKIENEIKKFERSLQKKLAKEDFDKLKKYRLINNLISVRDLKSPKALFKDSNELLADTKSSEKDIKKASNYLPPERFERRIWQIFNASFNSMSELNKAKKETEQLVKMMKHQGNDDVVERLKDTIEKIRFRRTLSPTDFEKKYRDLKSRDFVDINDVQQKAQEIISTDYDDVADAKRDKQRLDDIIKSFKEDNPENADQELSRIKFLLDRVDTKLQREII